jgi:signal transduction histidine kinase
VFAIVLVPLLLAGTFGGLRVYSGWTGAADLRLAADRAEMVPAIEDYMATLDAALLANSTGGDAQTALSAFDASKQTLQSRLRDTAVVPDVGKGVTALLQGGQALLDKVTANSIGLRDRVTTYAPILLTAEDVINGSVRVDDETIRAETLGLSRAIGARGQMMMQQLLVNLGGEIPEPELRTSMITLAGTEPSTLFGMSQVLGVGSADAEKLQAEMVKRMAMLSDPAVVLVNNPELTQSLQATNEVAGQVIRSTITSVTTGVEDQATAKRNEAIRDSVIVGVAILIALLIVTLVARTLVRPLRRLRDSALQVAHRDLAQELERVRAGGPADPVQPLPVHTTEEVGQVAHAVDELHEQAVLLAGEQARLQLQVGDMFETLSRRSRSLVDQQLTLIDRLESDEEDPERLESLFRLDHLAARMRRNGANLLVLAGSRVPREQAAPVPVAAVINAAASEVEDYTRVVTAVAPDSDILGVLAGDLVHLLAELMDNALRYSPPISQVRVSAVHTGNGGLVVEVSDIGLGMTEADLRVANTRLQSGGEVNPYTARHMGLFVVGRLAAQHGLVVRLRSTIAGEANSGTTAGVFIPAELLLRGSAPLPVEAPDYGDYTDVNTDSHAAIVMEQTFDDEYVDDEYVEEPSYEPPAAEYRNGHADIPISLLPQRNPGASGISGIPSVPLQPTPEPVSLWADEEEWPEDSMPAQTAGASEATGNAAAAPPQVPEPVERPSQAPTNTSAFFAARAQAANPPTNGLYPPAAPPPPPPAEPVQAEPTPMPEPAQPAAQQAQPSQTSGSDDAIFQKMLSEWLIDDPHELAQSTDLDWKTVWDNGWEAAAAAEESPVSQHTEHGLPMRQPGARLVPGAAEGRDDDHNGRHRNGGANGTNGVEDSADAGSDTGAHSRPSRDPEAVRASIGNHFGGVHAGRTHARETRGTDDE